MGGIEFQEPERITSPNGKRVFLIVPSDKRHLPHKFRDTRGECMAGVTEYVIPQVPNGSHIDIKANVLIGPLRDSGHTTFINDEPPKIGDDVHINIIGGGLSIEALIGKNLKIFSGDYKGQKVFNEEAYDKNKADPWWMLHCKVMLLLVNQVEKLQIYSKEKIIILRGDVPDDEPVGVDGLNVRCGAPFYYDFMGMSFSTYLDNFAVKAHGISLGGQTVLQSSRHDGYLYSKDNLAYKGVTAEGFSGRFVAKGNIAAGGGLTPNMTLIAGKDVYARYPQEGAKIYLRGEYRKNSNRKMNFERHAQPDIVHVRKPLELPKKQSFMAKLWRGVRLA